MRRVLSHSHVIYGETILKWVLLKPQVVNLCETLYRLPQARAMEGHLLFCQEKCFDSWCSLSHINSNLYSLVRHQICVT